MKTNQKAYYEGYMAALQDIKCMLTDNPSMEPVAVVIFCENMAKRQFTLFNSEKKQDSFLDFFKKKEKDDE